MAHWAWHSFPLPEGSTMADVPETGTIEAGRLKSEMRHASAKPKVNSWMFENPHRFNLGRFCLVDSKGKVIDIGEIKDPERMLDLWKGSHITKYYVGSSKNGLQNSWYGNWEACAKHKTQVEKGKNRANFSRTIDQVEYFVSWEWSDQAAELKEIHENHTFRLIGSQGSNSMEFVCVFSLKKSGALPTGNHGFTARQQVTK